jgi:predicted nucleic acid-binding protein
LTAPQLAYLDTSAFVKLVHREAETDALIAWLRDWPIQASSRLLWVETLLTVRRAATDPEAAGRAVTSATRLLENVDLIEMDRAVAERAARLEPPIRTLDAIHLATAELLGTSLGALVTYDARLAQAARRLGVRVSSPVPAHDAPSHPHSTTRRRPRLTGSESGE